MHWFYISRQVLSIILVVFTFGCQSNTPPEIDPGGPVAPHLTPDILLEPDRILDISIDMKEQDWDALRVQTRSIYDVLGPNCFSEPPPKVFTYFPAAVTIDGISITQVGVRKKGFQGSLDRHRPALKLKFDEYRTEQTFGGTKRMTLNNVKNDPSKIRTCLAYEVFRRAGLPASRCNFARLHVNGDDFGLYVQVEPIKKPFLREHFDDDAEGNLYEGVMSDFLPKWMTTFEKKTNKEENDWSDVQNAIASLEVEDDALEEAAAAAFNLDQFLTYWAIEVLIGFKDGYANRNNNYYVYRDANTDRFHFIPWGPDTTFHSFYDPSESKPHSILAHGHLTYRLYQNPLTQPLYIAKLESLLNTVWNETELLAEVDRLESLIEGVLSDAEHASMKEDLPQIREFISKRREEITTEWEAGPAAWTHTPSDPPCWTRLGSLTGSASTSWGTLEADSPLNTGTADVDLTYLDENIVPAFLSAAAGESSTQKTEGNAELRVYMYLDNGDLQLILLSINPADMAPGTTLPTDGSSAEAYLLQYIPAEGSTQNESTFLGFLTGGTITFDQAGQKDGDDISFSFSFEIYAPPEEW